MRRITALAAAAVSFPLFAGVSADEAAKLGDELTPIGAVKAGNADGSIPEWLGAQLFSQEVQDLTRAQLEEWRKNEPKKIEDLVDNEIKRNQELLDGEPLTAKFPITKAHYNEHADKLEAAVIAATEEREQLQATIEP